MVGILRRHHLAAIGTEHPGQPAAAFGQAHCVQQGGRDIGQLVREVLAERAEGGTCVAAHSGEVQQAIEQGMVGHARKVAQPR
jgi:hypothetical protein